MVKLMYDRMRDGLRGTIRGIGKLWEPALLISCPPAYVAQKSLSEGDYKTRWGRVVGTTVATGVVSAFCFVAGIIIDGFITDKSFKEDIATEQEITSEDRNLNIIQRDYREMDPPLIARKFLFPLEGLARYLFTDSYPRTQDTTVSGTVSRNGLEFEVEATLPGLRDAETITDRDLAEHSSRVELKKESYESFYTSEN